MSHLINSDGTFSFFFTILLLLQDFLLHGIIFYSELGVISKMASGGPLSGIHVRGIQTDTGFTLISCLKIMFSLFFINID